MKDYATLQQALDKATQKGAFNLQETGAILQALLVVHDSLKELEEYRKGLAAREGIIKSIK